MSSLADLYGSAPVRRTTGTTLQRSDAPTMSVAAPVDPALAKISAMVPTTPRTPVVQSGVAAGPTQSHINQSTSPFSSLGDGVTAAANGLSTSQLAIMNAVQRQLAEQNAAKQTAYNATPAGQTQNMIANRGVFAGGQTAAPPAARPGTALPPMQPAAGIAPRGGV